MIEEVSNMKRVVLLLIMCLLGVLVGFRLPQPVRAQDAPGAVPRLVVFEGFLRDG